MTHAENIENKLRRYYKTKKLSVTTSDEMDKKVISDSLAVYEKSNNTTSADKKPNTWRIIMNSKITKYATAAVLIIAVFIGINMLDGTPAYAIEQTVEAMRSLKSIHAFTTDWDDSQGEVWVQTNPETGQEKCYYADQGNLLIVATATPQATYYYHKDKNLVRIKKEYMPASQISFSRIFEDLPVWVEKYDGKYEIYHELDKELNKEIIVIHVDVPTFEKEFYIRIDPQTKLPINIETIKAKPGQGVKSVDNIQYNVSIPEGLFEFKVPEGAKVVYE